jgi:hypothetical protein
MQQLLQRIKERLRADAFTNEAAVSIGVIVPILAALGWDSSDPDQFLPEYATGRGRVDFALCASPRRPAIFIEVKSVGRSGEGDRQLFEYAFHEGVPLCVLSDGREWSFYLPSGQGTYEDRRVYRLQLDERSADECARVFERYLRFDRVKSGQAFEDAQKDYRDAAARREAARSLPQAWHDLVTEPEELMVELLSDRAEAICGFRPTVEEALRFLGSLQLPAPSSAAPTVRQPAIVPTKTIRARAEATARHVDYTIFGDSRSAPNANVAFVDILREMAKRKPEQLPALAEAAHGRSRNHVARTVEEIYPARPDLARAIDLAPGWLVGLNIANREKMRIVRAACRVMGFRFGDDVVLSLPNAS